MATKEFVITFLIIGLFTTCILAFGIELGNLNDANQSISNDPRFSAFNSSLSRNLTDIQEKGESSRLAFESENPILAFGEFIFQSIIAVGKTFTSGVFGFANLLIGIIFNVLFGGDPAFAVITGTLLTIMTIMIIFLLWKTYRSGD